jgi:hypothetical protein
MKSFKEFVAESGGPGWHLIHKGGDSPKKEKKPISNDVAHKAGFRAGLSGGVHDPYGSKEHWTAGHAAGSAVRKKLGTVPKSHTSNRYGEKKKNPEFEKVMQTHYGR